MTQRKQFRKKPVVIEAEQFTSTALVAKHEEVRRQRDDFVDALRKAEAEVGRLREFAEYALGQCSWGWNIPDGGSMQDKAEKLGLIVKVPADENFRAEYDSDEMFVCAWSPLASRLTAGSPEQENQK